MTHIGTILSDCRISPRSGFAKKISANSPMTTGDPIRIFLSFNDTERSCHSYKALEEMLNITS